MGNTPSPESKEQEIALPKYSSNLEHLFKKIDEKYNFLQSIPFCDYQLSLFNMIYSSESGGPTSVFEDETDSDYCAVFLKNSIASHPIFYKEKDELIEQIFIEYMQKMVHYIQKGASNFMKERDPEFNGSTVKKLYMILLGFLFCFSNPNDKIDSLFSLLENDKALLSRNNNIELFFYLLIFIPTFANYLAIVELQQNYDEKLPTLKISERPEYDKRFVVKKIKEVYDNFMSKFFDEGNMDYIKYKNKIQKEEFAWILTIDGIRSKF